MKRFLLAMALAVGAWAAVASASTAVVGNFGDHGWMSDDTRSLTGVDLVGLNYTHYGKPGQTPTAADDIAIAGLLQFVAAPAGATYGGALKIIQPDNNAVKATLSTVNTSGFAPATDLVGGGFAATYRWYMEPNTTARTLAFRVSLQSAQWAASQVGYTAIRSGESAWDLTLVRVMPGPVANDWNTDSVDLNTGAWYLYGQAGNPNWLGIAGVAPPGGTVQLTLAQWQADPTWGPILFGAGAKVVGVQLGLGSGQRNCNVYVDYLQTTLLNGGDIIDFVEYQPVRNVDTGELFATIQSALDDADTQDGHTITVAAGTYVEQLNVTKSVTIDGAGVGQTVILSPVTLTLSYTTTNVNKPVVFIHDTADAELRELTVDGGGRGNANYRFQGVAFWNAGGSLVDCDVLRVMDTPFSGAQHGVAVAAANNSGGPYSVALTNVLLDDFQKNGTALSGTGLTVALDNVTAVGAGPTGVTAQNGIQIWASGTVDNCHVSDVHWIYPGSGDRWTATGVLLFGPGTIDVSNTDVIECQTGIYFYDAGGSVADCVVTESTATPDGYDGIDIWTDPVAKAAGTGPRAVPLPFDEPSRAGAGKANVAVAITNTTVTGVDQGLENWGIWAGGEASIGLTVSGCAVTGWDYGVGTYDDYGGAVTAMCQGNTFADNRAYGFESTTATPADARDCDWGDPTGPYHATLNPLGLGNDVSDNVLFDPWSGQPELTIVPAASGPINCGDVQPLAFHYAAEAGAVGFKGYTVTVECTAPLTFGAADVHFVTPAGVTLGFPQVTQVTAGQKYIVDYGIMLPVGFAYVGETDLFTIDFHPTGTGTGTVTVSDVVFRNLTNVTIPVVEPGPATITVDCDAPAGVTDIAAAPAHRRVDLSWSASPSGDVASYEIWRAKWHRASPAVSAYPEYDDYPDNAIPAHVAAYPPGAEWTLAATVPAGTLTYGDVGDTNRGVYYYEVFAIDTAGNPSLPAPAYDRATNYWLGDVKSESGGDYDGRVYVADVSKLGAAYGQSVPLDGVNFQVDVGPTDDWSRLGIPLTDSVIDFEDLMVFAMNFDVVMPKAPPAGPAASVSLAWAPLDQTTWSLRLAEPCADLRGLNVAAVLPEGVVAVVSPGEVLTRLAGPWFLRNIDARGLDVGVAAFGSSLAGSGELLRVTLPEPADLASITVKARAGDNRSLEVRLDATSTPDSPLAFRLAQNVPNPFNPLTKIAFTLPSAQAVRLEVYAMDGRRVATLLDESRGAGRHEVVWDGRDGDGKVVASGTYFCRLLAGPYSDVRKMVLMK